MIKLNREDRLRFRATWHLSMFWKLFGAYLMIFYTDVFGLPAAAVGTMFLITRIWDSVFDPIVGVAADRTQTRWGKFRPYLLWLADPVRRYRSAHFHDSFFRTNR